MQHVKTRHEQSNIAPRSALNEGKPKKIQYSEWYKMLRGRNYEVEKIMRFLKEHIIVTNDFGTK